MAKRPITFKPSKAAEAQFMRALRQVGKFSGHIVEAHVDEHRIKDEPGMIAALQSYSKLITPWAKNQSLKMLAQVSQSNKKAYQRTSKEIGKNLRIQQADTEVGAVADLLHREQVDLIKSIPLKAGIRAQTLAQEAMLNGTRASEIAKELADSNQVSESVALRIARTEIAKSNASINQARAMAVGSTHYIWRNSGDGAVRESHRIYKGKKLDGLIFAWDDPPTLDDGHTIHPGNIYECRCYAQSILSDD